MAASNLAMRLGTAVVMIPLLFLLLYLGPAWGWLLFLMVIGAVAAFELFGMTHPGDRIAQGVSTLLVWGVMLAFWFEKSHPNLLLTTLLLLPLISIIFSLWRLNDVKPAAMQMAATTFGPLWIGSGIGAIALLRVEPQRSGAGLVVFSLMLAWMSDTGGYFAGRTFGKHKLYPKVSPKKTVEGAIGGVVATVIGAVISHFVLVPSIRLRDCVILGAVCSVLGMVGDLGESLLKRSVGVKDSGGIVPGHGGILDRADAVVITAPLLLLYLRWFGS